jgi:iron-sulfur cluster assembly protein
MVFVADSAKKRIHQIREKEGYGEDYFIRVWVSSGGCSGLTYELEFSNEPKPDDQVFEDNGIKVVTDLKSFLYLCNTTLEFSGGLDGKGFQFNNPQCFAYLCMWRELLCLIMNLPPAGGRFIIRLFSLSQ